MLHQTKIRQNAVMKRKRKQYLVVLGAEPWRRRLQILQLAADFTGLGLAVVNDVRNGIKLLNFRSVTVFAGDLAQCGHMMALKAVHELERKKTIKFQSGFH